LLLVSNFYVSTEWYLEAIGRDFLKTFLKAKKANVWNKCYKNNTQILVQLC
jgi:hypothetical protein